MKDLLMNCFYDNMTVSEAIDFITRCYSETPSQRQINSVKKTIKATLNKDWE